MELYRRVAEQGATNLPIAEPHVTRFWITLQEDVDFVSSALLQIEGGEIFEPKIPSMRITDLARAIS